VKIILRHVRSTCSLGIISCFVLFLTASAPHRVHHLFENLPKTHGHHRHAHPSIQSGTTSAVDHDTNDDEHSASPARAGTTHNDKNHDGNAQTVCLLQSAAQHSHLSDAQLVEIAFLSIESEERPDGPSSRLSPFNPSPFSQRAPPKL
jgi:hypothetical protein